MPTRRCRISLRPSFCAHILLVVLTLCAPFAVAYASTPADLWSQRFGNTGNDQGAGVVVDPFGNVIVVGVFSGTAGFGGGNLTSAGGLDVVLAKYDASGAHIWSQRFGGTQGDLCYSVAVDAAGSIFVVGQFSGTAAFGGGNLVSAGLSDIVLAKYSATGVHQWSLGFGSTGQDVGYSVAVDAAGNVLLTGNFSGTVNFGGGNLVSAGGLDIFLAKFSNIGFHVWSQRFGGAVAPNNDFGYSVAADALGNVLVTGSFTGTADFGGGNLVSAGLSDIFLAKYSDTGVHVWSRRFGSTSTDVGYSLAPDAAGNIFMAGQFNGTVDFGGGNLVSAGSSDIHLAKYDGAGTHLWSQRFGDTGVDQAFYVAHDGLGNVLLSGYFAGTVDFGGGVITSAGATDVIVAKYDAGGVHEWSRGSGGTTSDIGYGIAADASGNAFQTGWFNSTINFGGGNLFTAGLDDIFLVKFGGPAGEPVITSITDVGNDQGRKVKVLFTRSGGDDATATEPITRYAAFRRDDAAPASGAARAPMAEGWIEVGSVGAYAEDAYAMEVPTLGDSTIALGQYHSVYYIRAVADRPSRFFDSAPDSGWSVDNLAPGIPGSLIYSSGQLSWNESPAADFDYFTVYGANADAFGSSTVVDYTVDAEMDVTSSPYPFYFVTATDFSGNEGKPARVNTASGVGGTPRSYVLSLSNHPNPFNPRTTVSYTVPARGAVTITIHDARGARVATLVPREAHAAGAYRREWNGRGDDGTALASGIYFARIVHNDAVRTRKMVLLK